MKNLKIKETVARALPLILVALFFGCTPEDGGPCSYEEAYYEAIVSKTYNGGIWLQLEPNGRLLILGNEHVEGEAKKGDRYRVRVKELVKGSCVPTVALEAKRL